MSLLATLLHDARPWVVPTLLAIDTLRVAHPDDVPDANGTAWAHAAHRHMQAHPEVDVSGALHAVAAEYALTVPEIETTGALPDKLARTLATGRYCVALHLHGTPRASSDALSALLQEVARHYRSVRPEELLSLAEHGCWPHARPPIIISAFNGLANNAEVLVPALEQAGLTGWLWIPTEFPGITPDRARAYAHERDLVHGDVDEDGDVAMSWATLQAIASRGHVLCSHTHTHQRLHADLDVDQIEQEVGGSCARIEAQTGTTPPAIAWLFAGGSGTNAVADAAAATSGAQWLIGGWGLERIRPTTDA